MATGTPIRAVDSGVPSVARIYDYLLGGTTSLAVDRQVVEAVAGTYPGGVDAGRANVRANRRFLERAVRYLAGEAGVRQFLDIGSGIPNVENVHTLAQHVAPDARVVYVDNDTMVLAHTQLLLESSPEGATRFLYEDLRNTDRILDQAADTLDLTQPIALMLVSLLHMVADDQDPYAVVGRLVEALPSGSYVGLSHMSSDITPETAAFLAHLDHFLTEPLVDRTRGEIAGFLDGLELVEPGLVPVDQWRPDGPSAAVPGGRQPPWYGAVARKP
jgi:hypothetical protein